ncbi:MAG TPA: nicotinate (nicotinamide) nucleotide adenylyltransferase [Bryobacteraceae bacterium]|nr:nicotinate (nicotinamide) nucleotide adenylyltransferase [Bryobacteraceae bacterium]
MRLALFGGTFDPIHNAHLAVARDAADHFLLDQVLLIPNSIPPHKMRQATASYADRLAMVELAAQADPRFRASRLEESAGKSYSIQTVERVRQQAGPADEIFFLIGADAFSEIETWYRWQELVRHVEFIVLSRPGYHYDIPAGARVHRLETLNLDVSSTSIRQQLAAGATPPELPPAVLAYIRRNALYSG